MGESSAGVRETQSSQEKAPAPAPAAASSSATAGGMTSGGQSAELLASTPYVSHTVVSGDTLWAIASNYLGQGNRWPEIQAANPEVITDPNLIYPGSTLRVPAASDATVVAGDALDSAVCGEPEFPYVTTREAAKLEAADLEAERGRFEAIFTEWGVAGFDAAWFSLHTFYEGAVGVVLKWLAEWGAMLSVPKLTTTLEPAHARLALTRARATKGWTKLDAATKPKVKALLGGESNPLSKLARGAFKIKINDAAWAGTSDVDQATFLSGLLDSNTSARPGVTGALGDISPEPYTLSTATLVAQHQFRGVKADADKYTVTVGTDSAIIWSPHAPNAAAGHLHTVEQAAKSFASLPSESRKVVKSVTLNAAQNPDDAYWAVQYGTPNFRSYMTAGKAGDVVIYPTTNVQTLENMATSMIHETGHTWSKRKWGEDTTKAKWAPWRKAMASDRISVSNYATNSVSEDFSESLQIYQDSKGRPAHAEYKAMIPARFKIMDANFGAEE